MLNRLRYILLISIVLFNYFNVIAQIAMPDSVCIGNEKIYNVDANIVSGSTYIWRINGVAQTGSTLNDIHITWNTTGTYLLEVQELSADGCLGSTRSGQVIVSPALNIVTNSNSPVCIGSSLELTVETVEGGTYQWTGPNGYSSITQNPEILSATEVVAGTYYLTVSDNGCISAPSSIYIVVNNCIVDLFIPEGFSPNGDGINDLFVIRGIENYHNNKIVIFNRWGNKVFEASPYNNTWDGRSMFGLNFGGDTLPVGTYFYVLDLGNGTAVIKGYIYLNR